jgi:hypothetical protein
MTKPITDRPLLPLGRPSKYDPAYCDQVVEFCKQGFSISAFAGHIDVARSTINEWIANYPDFSEAVSRAKSARLLHWEQMALNVGARGGGPGTATIIVFGLKNMGGDEWTDTTKTEISGPGGKPVQVEETSARDKLSSKLARLVGTGRPAGGPIGSE